MSPVYLLLSVALVAVMCPQPGVSGSLEATITAEPAGDVKINTNVTLTCTASGGTGPYTLYTWKGCTHVLGDKSETCEMTAQKKGDVTVNCTVTDSKTATPDMATSNNYIVHFTEDPIQAKISADPTGEVKINTIVMLTCGASGGTEVYKKYSWTKNDQAVTGEERETYQLTAEKKGNVRVKCTVTDGGENKKTSDEITVPFSEAGIKAEISADQTADVKINTIVTLTCKASGGTEFYKPYTWKKGKETVIGHTGDRCTYNLTAKEKGEVEVSCSVRDNEGKTATSRGYSVTFSEDKIQAKISADKPGAAAVNTNVTLTCKASGGTEVYDKYSWTQDKVIVAGKEEKTYNVTAKQEGTVKVSCSVRDNEGKTAISGDYTVTFSGASKPTVSLAWSFSLGLILWAVLPSSRVELSL